MANLINLVWTIDNITFISPKWFGIFSIALDKWYEEGHPKTIFPNLWEPLVKVVWFVGKDFEIIEWYKVKIPWYFETRDSKYVTDFNKDYSPILEFKIKWDIDLVWGLESLSWLKAYIVRYIPWVWEKQADVLIETLWLDNVISTLDADNAIETIVKVRGIWQVKAEIIKESWDEWKTERNILIELGALWLSMNKCGLVYKTWGSKYKEILKDDPYRLTEIRWLWFAIADEVAMNYLGIWKKDPRRYAWIIEYLIREYASNNGDTIIALDNIKEWIKNFISNDPEFWNNDIEIIASQWIEKSIEKNTLYQINHNVFSLWYYALIETQIAKKIQEWKEAKKERCPKLDKFLKELEKTNITPQQLQAVEFAYTKKLSIILGWAGTWKTFTVWKLIDGLIKTQKDYAIITPTNKAAARVREVNPNANVSTIHALLWLKPWEEPMYNEECQLTMDYLIMDESSMLDNKVANKFFKAIDFSRTTVIFVWDPRQLPPVDAGSFFYDLIESAVIEDNITQLKEVKRANDSIYSKLIEEGHNITIITEWIHNIVANSLRILNGQMPVSTWFDCLNYFSDFSNKDAGEKNVIEKIKNIYLGLQKRGIDTNRDFQLYVPTYKTNLGIPKMNSIISDLVNPNEVIKLDRWQEYKLNDKVIFNDTDKDLGLTKWDIWTIVHIDEHNNIVLVDFFIQWKIELKNAQLDSLDLGYAISVHRAQWTEVKYWGILLVKSFYMLLTNQLLYTAYTRWKEKVFLFGDEEAYKTALKTHINARNTLLFHLLANTPINDIYPTISRKSFWISDKELKQIKMELVKKDNLNIDDIKIIKIDYKDNSQYKYYRYIYWLKTTMSELNLFDGQLLTEDEVSDIEWTDIKFLRIKKYNNQTEKRWIFNKVVKNEKTYFIEINTYNKDVTIS